MAAGGLPANESLLALLFDDPSAGRCLLAPDGTVLRVNRVWLRANGLEDGVEGADLATSYPERAQAFEALRARLTVEQREARPTQLRRLGGGATWWEESVEPVPMDGGSGLLVTIREVSPAEDSLRESEQKFATIFDKSPFAMDLVSMPERRLVAVNEAWTRLMGVAREEAVGRTTVELGLVTDLEGRARAYAELDRSGSIHGFERVFQTRTGGRRILLTNSDAVTLGGARFVLGALQDVTDWKLAEEALRDADRRKDEFLGMLSHELRNPLAPIRNAVWILRHDVAGQQARHAQDVIQRQTEHLTRLVDDLLDVTRIARGKIELRRERVELRELVRRTAEDHRLELDDRCMTFRVALPQEKLWTTADPVRLAQVVGNLLHNAAKFARSGDEVRLSLRQDGEWAEIVVADTGPGIDPALLPHVFEAFVQGDRTLARSRGGLGLGLSLVKGIAELHGGSVQAASGGRGTGATLSVRLPLVAAEEPGLAAAASARTAGPGRRILVVDDNRDAAESLAQIVGMLGHEAELAYDGQTAVAIARRRLPDVVLCDIGLPEMDGYEVARQIRAFAADRVRLIAVTGYAQPEDVARAAEAGFTGHLAKPADPERLEQALG